MKMLQLQILKLPWLQLGAASVYQIVCPVADYQYVQLVGWDNHFHPPLLTCEADHTRKHGNLRAEARTGRADRIDPHVAY
jgi:hypothetical protein